MCYTREEMYSSRNDKVGSTSAMSSEYRRVQRQYLIYDTWREQC